MESQVVLFKSISCDVTAVTLKWVHSDDLFFFFSLDSVQVPGGVCCIIDDSHYLQTQSGLLLACICTSIVVARSSFRIFALGQLEESFYPIPS